jgi:hypothetical protein
MRTSECDDKFSIRCCNQNSNTRELKYGTSHAHLKTKHGERTHLHARRAAAPPPPVIIESHRFRSLLDKANNLGHEGMTIFHSLMASKHQNIVTIGPRSGVLFSKRTKRYQKKSVKIRNVAHAARDRGPHALPSAARAIFRRAVATCFAIAPFN